MNLILFAHHNWGVKTIQTLDDSDHKILHVFVHPEFMDKNETEWYESVKNECQNKKIPFSEISKINSDIIDLVHKLSPDLILSVGWRRLLPKSILDIPKHGAINMHEALLPAYRGFAPLNWAIINGETETGITIHFIDVTADTGDIILQNKVQIDFSDLAIVVHHKLLKLVPDMILEVLKKIDINKIDRISQKKMKGFFCSRRFPDDGQINWNENRIKIYNQIRALSDPFPNAFCFFENKKIYIKNAILIDEDIRGPPGRICVFRDDGMVITCGRDHTKNQSLLIKEISIGEKVYNPNDFFKKLWIKLD